MNRIIWHHTGGGYRPSQDDLRAYHFLIDGDGAVHRGLHPVLANAPGRALRAGQYAAHCLNLNSGAIGVSVCAMRNGVWQAPYANTPVRPVQISAMLELTAELCEDYRIPVTQRTTLSHAEVEPTLGVKQRNKWDFDYDPLQVITRRDPVLIGDSLRSELSRLLGTAPQPQMVDRPTLSEGDTGAFVVEMKQLLGITPETNAFDAKTRAAVVAYQRRRQLLPDGIVGPMTWAALLGE